MYYVAAILLFLIGLELGLNLFYIKTKLKELLSREPDPEPYVATPLPPGYSHDSAGIVTPKTPAEIDFEQEQRLRELE